jgi:hypothetical protein
MICTSRIGAVRLPERAASSRVKAMPRWQTGKFRFLRLQRWITSIAGSTVKVRSRRDFVVIRLARSSSGAAWRRRATAAGVS